MARNTWNLSDAAGKRIYDRLTSEDRAALSYDSLLKALEPENPGHLESAVRDWMRWAVTGDGADVTRVAALVGVDACVQLTTLRGRVRAYRSSLDEMCEDARVRRPDERPDWAS